jgi:hypothetical protein
MKRKVIIALAFQALTSCFWDPNFSHEIKKPYYLGVDYGTNQVCLHWTEVGGAGGTEKIPSKIKKIGWDDRFIIAEQESVFEKGRTNYYTIDMENDGARCYDCPIGPMTKQEFLNMRNSLGIPETLDFKLKVEDFDVTEIK